MSDSSRTIEVTPEMRAAVLRRAFHESNVRLLAPAPRAVEEQDSDPAQ